MKAAFIIGSILTLAFLAGFSFPDEAEYFFPKENPIFSLSLPDDWMAVSSMFPNSWREWTKEDVQGPGAVPIQASPDFTQKGRLLFTLWAFVPDAVAGLESAEKMAAELVAERFTDFVLNSETREETEINGIPFILMDATGKEKAQDGAAVNAKAAFFNPEGTHVFLLLVTGSPEMLEKYGDQVKKILSSIKPGK